MHLDSPKADSSCKFTVSSYLLVFAIFCERKETVNGVSVVFRL